MNRLRALAAIALFLPIPALAAEPKPPNLALDAYRLPNGLKVALHRDPTVPRVTVCVAYHVGSKNERAGRTGFAHFFEHMMFRGTKNVPNYDIPLQETGAQSNAFTSEDMTVYYETVPSSFLERAIYLEAERLAFLPSALDQEKFDTEREVVKNERRQSMENVPYGLAQETILAAVFPKGHPYSWDVIGSMKDLSRATLDDLRKFFAEFYSPSNATLCLAGDFEPEVAKKLIDKYFGVLAPGVAPPKVVAPPSPATAKKIVQADKVQLPRTYWAWPTPADGHPDTPALDVLDSILSSGEASRLHRALVVEKRVAKDIDSSSDTKDIAGLFTVEATAAEGKTLDEVEAALEVELGRLRNEEPSEAEMQRVLAKYETGLFTRLTSPLGRAITLSTGFAQKDDPAYYRADFDRHARVTAADVKRVAQTYLKPEKVVLWIEPTKPDQPESPAVEAGPNPGAPDPDVTLKSPRPGPDWAKLPGPSEPVPFRAPRITRKKLANGLDVWIAPWKTLPIVSAQLILPAGTADDPAGKAGLATLAASLFDKGTKSLNATELAEQLEALGGGLRVGAGADDTTVAFSGLARQLEPKLALLGEILAGPRLDSGDVDRERQLQLTDLLQGPDSPAWIARRAFPALLYGPKHPYGHPAQGYPETVKDVSAADLRSWYQSRFVPEGSTLILVGDVEPEALIASLEKALGGWKGGPEPKRLRPAPEVKPEAGIAYLADKPGAVQSVLAVGRRWVDRADPRYFATLIGNHALGADFLSRLNQNLREEHGYSYGAGSAFRFRKSGSTWSVNTSVRADVTAEALKEVLKELDDLPEARPLSPEEVAVARDAEVRGYPETFESPNSIAGILEEIAQFGLPADYLNTYLDQLQAVTPDQIARAMRAVVDPTERVVLVVGDRKTVEPKLKALGFKEIRIIDPDGKPLK